MASTTATIGTPAIFLAFQSANIAATTTYGTVVFTETSFITQNLGFFTSAKEPEVDVQAPLPPFTVTAGAGSIVPGAFVAKVTGAAFPQIGAPIPGVSVSVVQPTDFTMPSPLAHCINDPLSDQTGVVSCTLQVDTCTLGSSGVIFSVGGGFKLYSGSINVVQGSASAFKKLAGDNQTGTAGQLLPVTLTALVSDGCGNASPGAKVTWSVTQGSASLSSTVSTADSSGRVSTKVTLGQTPGTVLVRVSVGNSSTATFTLTNSIAVSSLTLLSGNNQSAQQNQTFAQPLTVTVRDAQNNLVQGVIVTFSVTSGSANIAQPSATSDSQGRAFVTLGAGPTAGPVVITASYGNFSVTFNETVQPPAPVITAASFSNAAFNANSGGPAGLVPCSLSTVIGAGLAPGINGIMSGNAFGPLSMSVAGVSITVGGVAAPIQAVANQNGVQSVNFQTPCEAQPGSTTVVVTVNGNATMVSNVTVLQAQPGVFNYVWPTNGKTYGAVIRASDGSYISPGNPAHRGETLLMVVTGLGQTSPAATTNNTGVPGQNVVVPLVVGVNNAGVFETSAQYQVGGIGVYLVAFQIPLSASTSPFDQPLALETTVNGQPVFSNPTLIPVN
jgi:uncharacterized protein (TIGR03437 family)